jgi:hypothetical protein
MRRHTILDRGVTLALVAATVLVAGGAPPRKKVARRAAPPPLPELNRKVLEYARGQVGKQVGDGECSTLPYEALKSAGARRFPWARSGDYVWGRPVASLNQALPGDILQFRDTVFDGKRWVTPERWMSWHYEYPHHTAIVAEVRDAGREVVVLHQNVHNGGNSTPIKLVQEGTLWLFSLQPGGHLWIYRPIGFDEDPVDPVETTTPKPQPTPRKPARPAPPPGHRTEVSIRGARFLINGRPTYEGRSWHGRSIEGLLINSRMVQGIFDDLNPETRPKWAYPDTGRWDPARNTREFLAAMPEWRRHGLLAFTINLQGGSPQGYSVGHQPWHNSAITPAGTLRPDYLDRLGRILDRADELGMAVILGIFYFGQDERLVDEAAVVRAVDAAVDWVFDRGYHNVLIEVDNECNVGYDHAILRPERVDELIERVKSRTRDGRRLLAGVSYGGGSVPRGNVVRASDFLLMHGNGVNDPARIAAMVRQARAIPGYRPMPILFNEDDHFDFDRPSNNFEAALAEGASWGFFDPGQSNYRDGYQSPPVNWGLNTERKRAFFARVADVTGTHPSNDRP